MILSEKIVGTTISTVVESSNLSAASYDTATKLMTVTFKNGRTYNYHEVPWEVFTRFRMAESQGKYLRQEIMNHFKHEEVKNETTTDGDQRKQ